MNLVLVGGQFASVALWWGSVTTSTLLLLAGCGYALAVYRPAVETVRQAAILPSANSAKKQAA